MTQAFNLSQLANNLNSSGQLDATDGLVNAVPVTNGGTGASDATAARTNLAVPSVSGSGASGTWSINITGNAATATNATNSVNATNSNYATTAGNGGVTSVNGLTGDVSLNISTNYAAIGTYVVGRPANALNYTVGSTVAGSSLYATSIQGTYNDYDEGGDGWSTESGQTFINVGTWRCMSPCPRTTFANGAAGSSGLWVRIS